MSEGGWDSSEAMHQLGDVTQKALQSSSHGEVESPWLSEGVSGTAPQQWVL